MRFSLSRRAFAALALGGAGATPSTVRAATFEIKCGGDNVIDSPQSVRLTQMWAAIEKESGGRIRAKVYPNSVLGSASSMFQQVREGALQFTLTVSGVIAAVVPVIDIAYVGFAFKDPDEGLRAFAGPLGAYVRVQAEQKGIRVGAPIWDAAMQQIGIGPGWKPIRTPDDMKGFKVRLVPSPILLGMFKDLGANGVGMSIAEVYTALQTRLIDGEASSLVTTETFKFFEVLKYISLTNHAWSAYFLTTSTDYWKSLPPDLQAIIERNNAKYAALVHRDITLFNASTADKLVRQGMTVNTVDQEPFRARLKTYYQTWATHFGTQAWTMLESAINRKLA